MKAKRSTALLPCDCSQKLLSDSLLNKKRMCAELDQLDLV